MIGLMVVLLEFFSCMVSMESWWGVGAIPWGVGAILGDGYGIPRQDYVVKWGLV